MKTFRKYSHLALFAAGLIIAYACFYTFAISGYQERMVAELGRQSYSDITLGDGNYLPCGKNHSRASYKAVLNGKVETGQICEGLDRTITIIPDN